MASLKLSVLDQSPVPAGARPEDALANTVDLARAAERLGYSRYWLAEHHNTRGLAGPAPEVMVATVAAATEAIRVGSGGVMLPHYSSLKVAEQFRVLATLHPGRIDLGIGRAPGGDQMSAAALRIPTPEGDRFPNQVQDLIGFLEDRLDPRHPFARVRATPEPPTAPPVWLLETSEEALRLTASVRLWRRRLMRGDPGPFPSVDEALAELGHRANEAPRDGERRLVYGNRDEVRVQ